MAERLLGSAGIFDQDGRRSWSSVNFAACHDGFCLADVAAYSHKHNDANGEDNRDGHNENYSDNCGVEGETDDAEVLARRGQRVRNLLATVFLAQGTPMLLAGDEIGASQGGNNNAYCQDNEISWIDWQAVDQEHLDYVRALIGLRKAHPCLRQSWFLHGGERRVDGEPDVKWLSLDGGAVNWRDPGLAGFILVVRESAEAPSYATNGDVVAIVFNGATRALPARLPAGRDWLRALDTSSAAVAAPAPCDGGVQEIPAQSIVAFATTQ